MGNVFITGGTGFLGRYIINNLIEMGFNVFALGRSSTLNSLDRDSFPEEVVWIEGDLSKTEIIKITSKDSWVKKIDYVIHAAALYDLAATEESLYLANVVGTHNLIHLCEKMPSLKAFHHISTIAIGGTYNGTFFENQFNEGQSFLDGYGRTKYSSEACVRNWSTPIKRRIYRLGVLVGDSSSGYLPRVDGLYYLMMLIRGISKNPLLRRTVRILPIPFNERSRLPMLPVDYAARVISTGLGINRSDHLLTYHVTGPNGGESIRDLIHIIRKHYGLTCSVVAIPNIPFIKKLGAILKIPEGAFSYLSARVKWDQTNLKSDFEQCPNFREYWQPIVTYADEHLFKEPK